MGTNFYFKVKKDVSPKVVSNGVEVCFLTEKLINSVEDWDYIHIGKRSGGWVPLFQETQWFSSVEGIKNFYDKNNQFVDIVNEYDEFLTWDELNEELIMWNRGNPDVRRHIEDGGYIGYFRDSEGYEFTSSDFS